MWGVPSGSFITNIKDYSNIIFISHIIHETLSLLAFQKLGFLISKENTDRQYYTIYAMVTSLLFKGSNNCFYLVETIDGLGILVYWF